MKKRKKRERPYEINRYRIGLHVMAGGLALPQAHVVYEVLYSDGTSRIERGKSVFGMGGARIHTKTQTKEAELTSRPDLFASMHAASILNRQIEEACLWADGHFDRADRLKKKRYKDEY